MKKILGHKRTRAGVLINARVRSIGHVLSVAFSPDGKRLVAGCTNTFESNPEDHNKARILDVFTGDQLRECVDRLPNNSTENDSFVGRARTIDNVNFSPDGKLVVGSSYFIPFRCRIPIWNSTTGQQVEGAQGAIALHDCPSSVVFLPDNKKLCIGFANGSCEMWQTGEEKNLCLLRVYRHLNRSDEGMIALGPNGRKVMKSYGCTLQIISIFGQRLSRLVEIDIKGHSDIQAAGWTPNGNISAIAYAPAQQKWNWVIFQNRHRILKRMFRSIGVLTDDLVNIILRYDGVQYSEFMKEELKDHGGWGSGYKFTLSPDCTRAARVGRDNTIEIWHGPRRKLIGIGHTDTINSIAFSREGRLVASGSDDGTVKIWKNDGDNYIVFQSFGG